VVQCFTCYFRSQNSHNASMRPLVLVPPIIWLLIQYMAYILRHSALVSMLSLFAYCDLFPPEQKFTSGYSINLFIAPSDCNSCMILLCVELLLCNDREISKYTTAVSRERLSKLVPAAQYRYCWKRFFYKGVIRKKLWATKPIMYRKP
jgi:hypothetical protein